MRSIKNRLGISSGNDEDLWHPRTEMGRTIKHKLKKGLGESPPERQYKNR